METVQQCCISEELLSAYSFRSQLWSCGLYAGPGIQQTLNRDRFAPYLYLFIPAKIPSRFFFHFYFVANVFWESKFIHVSMPWLYLATQVLFFILLKLPPAAAFFELNEQRKGRCVLCVGKRVEKLCLVG